MVKKYFLILNLTLIYISVVQAQDYKLFVSPVSEQKALQLKWLSKTPVKNIGFNLYRKENAGWVKVNNQPIMPSPVITNEELKSAKNLFPDDTDYTFYVEINNLSKADAKTTQNNDFILYYGAALNNTIAKHVGILYTDNTVENGKSYTYKLTRADNDKELAISEKTTYTSYVKPAAPIDFKAIPGDKHIDFTWKLSPAFLAYNLYLKDGNTLKMMNEEPILLSNKQASSLYVIDNLVNGRSYSYQLSGIDYFGNESQLSPLVTVTPEDNVAPHNVRNLQIKMEKNTVVLKWRPSTSDDIKGYNVYKSNEEKGVYTKINANALSLKDTLFTDKNITADGSTNFYYVESFDANNNSAKTPVISAFIHDQIPPAMPKNTSSRVESGKIFISWEKNTENDLAGYRIYRGLKDDDQNSMALLNSKPTKQTTLTDTFPKETGAKFVYKITAMDNSFNESEPSVVIAQLPDIIPPLPPYLSEAKYNDGKISLRWKASLDDDITGFKIWRKSETEKEFKLLNTNLITGNSTSFEDKSIIKNTSYEYWMQAVDSAGNSSEKSNKVVVLPTASTIVENPKLSARYDKNNKQVVLKYNVDEKNDNIEGYVIYRKTEKTNLKQLFTPDKTGSYVDKKIEEEKIYYYSIQIFFINGEPSVLSEPIKVETK